MISGTQRLGNVLRYGTPAIVYHHARDCGQYDHSRCHAKESYRKLPQLEGVREGRHGTFFQFKSKGVNLE